MQGRHMHWSNFEYRNMKHATRSSSSPSTRVAASRTMSRCRSACPRAMVSRTPRLHCSNRGTVVWEPRRPNRIAPLGWHRQWPWPIDYSGGGHRAGAPIALWRRRPP
ncbi:hypothetical protein JB92DRAFT_2852543 [Gautieria morchelliformis]|nr:hypothetical protein JB92DRAFT_2852543 [Gautieria morchelliformis]